MKNTFRATLAIFALTLPLLGLAQIPMSTSTYTLTVMLNCNASVIHLNLSNSNANSRLDHITFRGISVTSGQSIPISSEQFNNTGFSLSTAQTGSCTQGNRLVIDFNVQHPSNQTALTFNIDLPIGTQAVLRSANGNQQTVSSSTETLKIPVN